MAVKLTSGEKFAPSLTSPPSRPVPYPADKLIAKKVEYDDREVLVTVPFPDTIVLITDIQNHHLDQPYETGSDVWIYSKIDEDMTDWVNGYKSGETWFAPSPKISGIINPKAVFRLPYDPTQPLFSGYLTIARRSTKMWSIKLEFSVSKAGPAGLANLISLLGVALPLKIEKVLGSMGVRRIDPAIDLIGVEPIDLIPHVQKPGKRLIYVGDHGRPESVYLYEKKTPLKQPPQNLAKRTTGPLRLKLYERRSYFEQLKLEPPYGPSPVTRAEVQCEWDQAKYRPRLADLASLANQLQGRRVAYAATAGPPAGSSQLPAWIRFCLASFGGGVRKSATKHGMSQGFQFRALYEKSVGDLMNEQAWSLWTDGLAYVGLNQWIAIAKANPPPKI